MRLPEEMSAIADEVAKIRATEWYHEIEWWQYPAFLERITLVRDLDDNLVVVSTLQPEGCCGAYREACVCALPAGHDVDAHVCGCGGSWRPDRSVVRYPGPFSTCEVASEDREPTRPWVSRGGIQFLKPPTFGETA